MAKTAPSASLKTGLVEALDHMQPDELVKLKELVALLPDESPPVQSTAGAKPGAAITAAVTNRVPQTMEQLQMNFPTTTTTTTTATAAASSLPNAPQFADVLKDITALGEAEAKGKDGWVQCLLKLAEASFIGAIDQTADKHGKDVDDATKLARAYVQGARSSSIFDKRPPVEKKTASCMRTMIKLGMWPHGGPSEPLSVINTFMTIYRRARNDGTRVKLLVDASNALLTFARAQTKLTSVIPDDELMSFMLRKEPDPKEEEDWLEDIRKKALKAKDGKGGVQIDASTADKIVGACSARLRAIVKAKGAQPADAQTGALATADASPVPVTV